MKELGVAGCSHWPPPPIWRRPPSAERDRRPRGPAGRSACEGRRSSRRRKTTRRPSSRTRWRRRKPEAAPPRGRRGHRRRSSPSQRGGTMRPPWGRECRERTAGERASGGRKDEDSSGARGPRWESTEESKNQVVSPFISVIRVVLKNRILCSTLSISFPLSH